MDKSTQQHIKFQITKPKKRPIIKTVNVKDVVGKGLRYIDRRCASRKSCNEYFLSLSKRSPISLRQILEDKRLDIYRLRPMGSATNETIPAGLCFGWGKTWAEIGINGLVPIDHMEVANVLLHDLAHVAGAPGRREDAKSLAAEKSLLHCGMRTYYNPGALGSLDSLQGPEEQRTARV